MQLITISGLDGSGKTTQLELLTKKLNVDKKSVYSLHIIDFSIATKFLGRKKKISKNKPAKSITSAGKFSIFLRKLALLLDVLRFRQLMFALKMNGLYEYVLVDRYFYDQIVNIHYLEKNLAPSKDTWWQKAAEKIMVKPHYSLFVKVSSDVAISRDREIEQGKQFLLDKQKVFNAFIGHWGIITIDGEGSVKETFTKIKNKINIS